MDSLEQSGLDRKSWSWLNLIGQSKAGPNDAAIIGFTPAGAGAVTRTVQDKERDIVSVFDSMTAAQIADVRANALTLDVTTAIQTAWNLGVGVWHPAGSYKSTATLNKPTSTSLYGAGQTTIFSPVSCDFLSFSAGADQQNASVRDFAINGTTCTTNTALKSVGTADRTVIVTGQHISCVSISNYHTAMNFRNFHQCVVRECWAQNIDNGLILAGQDMDVDVFNNRFVMASGGGGAGPTVGITVKATSDYNPGGNTTLFPESVHIEDNNLIFGFATAVSIQQCTLCVVNSNDIEASVTGVEWTTITGNLDIKDNYIQVDGAAANYGVHGTGLAAAADNSITNIEGNTIIATSAVTAVGVQLNGTTPGAQDNQNQTNVRIVGNILTGWPTNDIMMNAAGDVDIIGNRCRSAITTSILVKSALASRPITIDQNRCAGNINVPNANTPLAQMVVGANYGLFSTYIRGTSTITNGNTTVTTTYASLTPTTNNFDSEANTGMKQKLFIGAPSTNIGAVWGTASATQVVLTCATASVGSTIIPWEVRAFATGLG